MQDQLIPLKGSLKLVLKSIFDNSVVEERDITNLITTQGRQWVLQHIAGAANFGGNTTSPLSYLAVGTSTTAPTTADTALNSETTRLTFSSLVSSNLTSNPPSYELDCSFATNLANTTLGEVGLFNSSAGGTMLAHATFGTINKTTSNTLGISYTVSG